MIADDMMTFIKSDIVVFGLGCIVVHSYYSLVYF